MKIRNSILFILVFALSMLPESFAADETVNWNPMIFANGQVYNVQFQHTGKNLTYSTSVETVDIDGIATVATVVRFAPNILNAGAPTQNTAGNKVSRNLYDFNLNVNLTGQESGAAIVVEIYEFEIDLNDLNTIGNPKGKGTLVSNKPPEGGSN